MKTLILCTVMLLTTAMVAHPGRAQAWQNVPAVQGVNYLLLADDEKKDLDLAIQIYLNKYPPEALLSFIYSTVENTMPRRSRNRTGGR